MREFVFLYKGGAGVHFALNLNKSRSCFGKNYNLVFLIIKIQKIGGKFEFILLEH